MILFIIVEVSIVAKCQMESKNRDADTTGDTTGDTKSEHETPEKTDTGDEQDDIVKKSTLNVKAVEFKPTGMIFPSPVQAWLSSCSTKIARNKLN